MKRQVTTFAKHPLATGLILLAMVGGLLWRAAQMNGPDVVIDDAFISFRYATNLAQGNGLVFNPGERVEGYTNFLWTVLLALSQRAGLEIVWAAKLWAALAAAGSLLALYALGKSLFASTQARWLALVAPLVFAATACEARYVASGMETLFFGFWLVLGTALCLREAEPLLVGSVFALAALTRPEGVFYFGLVWGYCLFLQRLPGGGKYSRRAGVIRLLLGFGLLYAVYFLWRYSYYGYPFPNTYYAKTGGFSGARLERGWETLLQVIQRWQIGLALGLAALSLPGWRLQRAWLLVGSMVAATLAYFVYVGGDFIVWFGPRFLMPMYPFLLLLVVEGIRQLAGWKRFRPRLRQIAGGTLLACLLVLAWTGWPGRYFSLPNFATQMRAWKELGLWIEAHTPPQSRMATDAAGLIPYYSRRYTLDMFGLTDAHIAHVDIPGFGSGTAAHEKTDPLYILAQQPDCIASTWMDEQGRAVSAGLANVQAQFTAAYHLVAVAKVRAGPPLDGRWVIATSSYSTDLYQQGYVTGLFCREGALLDAP